MREKPSVFCQFNTYNWIFANLDFDLLKPPMNGAHGQRSDKNILGINHLISC